MELLWTGVLADNGTLETRPINKYGYRSHDNGIYPFGLPLNYSWYFGGESYLGEPTRVPPATWSSLTEFHLVYPEAVSAGGAAKATVPCNVIIQNRKSWVHLKTGGWKLVQSAPPDFTATGRFTGPQTGNQASALTITKNADGSFTEPSPPPGWCNHGWTNSRGAFTPGTVDGAFSYFEMRVDKEGANLLGATGIDWWQSPSAPFPNNTGYSMSAWKRLTTSFQAFTGSSLDPAILLKDPPPPLVAVKPPVAEPPVVTPPVVVPVVPFVVTLNGVPLKSGDVLVFKVP